MAIKPDWTLGTLTLTAGSTAFTTTGSALKAADIQGGDTLMTQSGAVLVIETITGENSGTLYMACPALAAGADQPLRVRYQADGSRLPAATRHLLNELSSGNVAAFAELVGQADMVPIFTGAGMLTLVSTELLGGGGGSWTATVALLSGRDAFNDKPAGFRVLVIENGTNRSAVYEKTGTDAADWSEPIYFTGAVGEKGSQGDTGQSFKVDAFGLLSDRSIHDIKPEGFSYLATDMAQLFIRLGCLAGLILFLLGRGEDGEQGEPGKDGSDGDNGLTAYQVAVQNGFTGTQQEWLASLNGSDASVTTSSVGAAVAAAASEQAISDGDTVAGVKSGTSSMRRWTWGIVKAWIKSWITKADVGLPLVDNTSDANKPISTAQAAAIAAKQDKLNFTPANKAGDSGLGFFQSILQILPAAGGTTVTPPLTGSNFKSLPNNGNFTLAAPANGTYDMKIFVWPSAGAGSMTATGFSLPPKGAFKPSAINILRIEVVDTYKYLTIEVKE